MTYTLEEARARCRFWQAVLRLQDWNITVEIARRQDMHSASAAAQVWISDTSRLATIKLLDPVDVQPSADAREQDMDDSLVHELLHVHLHDCHVKRGGKGDDFDPPEQIAEERAIEAITAALVTLDHEKTLVVNT